MNVLVKAGLILAILVVLFSAASILLGWHTDPRIGNVMVGVAILLNLSVVYWALRQTASYSNYRMQVFNGLVIGLIAGALIFLGSWLLFSVVFPEALDEMRAGYLRWMEESGKTQQEIAEVTEMMQGATPMSQAVRGFIWTLFTSVLVAAITGIFRRKA